MTAPEIAGGRLVNQRIARPPHATPKELLAWLGAMQAQDFLGALWAIGLRLPGGTEADVRQAIVRRELLRTWPMRGTLHFVPAVDARWMLELMTPRILARAARRHQELELDAAVFARCRKLLGRVLAGPQPMPRDQIQAMLGRAGIAATGARGYHLFWRLAQEGFLCFGPHLGKQPTFVLLEEWVPRPRRLAREEALAELARRFFISRGPATLADFVWWSGLKLADARAGLALVAPHLVSLNSGGQAHYLSSASAPVNGPRPPVFLLPSFDEYLLGYTRRDAVLEPRRVPKIIPGHNGMFKPILVVDGQVTGTWTRVVTKKSVSVTLDTFRPLTKAETQACAAAAEAYGRFLGLPVALTPLPSGRSKTRPAPPVSRKTAGQ
jgi:hypothetical protein